MTVRRVDALEAGIRFTTWVFSNGCFPDDDVRKFITNIGMSWSEVEESLNNENKTVRLIEGIKRASSSMGLQVFAWFEVGRNTTLLSNMVATGAPSSLIDAAMSGYRRYLEDAQIRIDNRDKIQILLKDLATGSLNEKTSVFNILIEILREQASIQDENAIKIKSEKPVEIQMHLHVNSPTQQNFNSNSSQTTTYNIPLKNNELNHLVEILSSHLSELKLSSSDEKKAKAQLSTIAAQLLDEPNPSIVKEAAKTLRNITEGSIGSLTASAMQPAIWATVQTLLAKFSG